MSHPETTPGRKSEHRRVFVREREVLRVQRKLENSSFPRLQMTLIVGLTGASGFLSSFLLLHQGMDVMALRYPLALALAYGVFLFLIWLWLKTRPENYADLPDMTDLAPSSSSSGEVGHVPFRSGGGGDFGGGGASASFDAPSSVQAKPVATVDAQGESASALGGADEFAIPALAIALTVGLALASFHVIYMAPALLAEVLVDSALSYVLYRHLRGEEPSHWLATAVRQTILPFLATAVFLIIVGASLAAYAPGARSIGEVVHGLAQPK